MISKKVLFRIMGVIFLLAACGLLGAAFYIDDLIGIGYLMGLFTISLVNTIFFFSFSREKSTDSIPAEAA